MITQTSDAAPSTAERILDVAQRLAQTRGYNGFSYADIAGEIGITKASLHYHFPTKAQLGRALIERYTERFESALGAISASGVAAPGKLEGYVDLYESVLVADRLCLCGMFAAEIATLPEEMQDGVRRFFTITDTWLEHVFAEGRATATLDFEGEPMGAAVELTAALDGAMLVARAFDDLGRFTTVAARCLASYTARS